MTTPFVDALERISATWEALTPPDRPLEVYVEDESKKLGADVSSHRKFAFSFPEGPNPDTEDGIAKTISEWTLSAEVFFSTAGRNQREAVIAYANETSLLRRSIDKVSTFPAGVLDLQVIEVRADVRGDDVIAVFTFNILAEETD